MNNQSSFRRFLGYFLLVAVFFSSFGSSFLGLHQTAMAATYNFSQTTFSGGATTTSFPTHASNSVNSYSGTWWNQYYSKDASTTASTVITLASSSRSITQTDNGSTNTGFNMATSSNSSTAVTGSGDDALVELALSSARFQDILVATSSLPSNNGLGVAFHPNGKYIAVGGVGSPYLHIYNFDPDTYTIGNKITDSVTSCGSSIDSVSFHPEGRHLMVSCGGTSVMIYDFTPSATYNATSGIISGGVSRGSVAGAMNEAKFSPNGKFVAIAHGGSPYLSVYSFSTSTKNFVTLINPTDLPDGTGRGIDFSTDGAYIGLAHSINPFVSIYTFNSSTGAIGSTKKSPSNVPGGAGSSISFHPSSSYVAVGSAVSNEITIYNFNGNFGNKLTTSTLFDGSVEDVRFSPDGSYIAFAVSDADTPFHYVLGFNATSTWNATANVIGGNVQAGDNLPDDGNGIAFHPSSTFLAMAHHGSPYFSVYARVPRYPTVSGIYTSGPIDFGSKQNFTTLQYASSGLSGTSITIDVRAGNDASPPTSWTSSTANWSTSTASYVSNITSSSVSIAGLSGYQYLRYRATLSNGGTDTKTPSLESVTINSYAFPTSSTLLGSPFNAGDSTNVFSAFKWTDNASTASGTDVLFQVRTGASTGTLGTFVGPGDSASTYFSSSTCSKASGLVSCTIPSTSTLRDGSSDQWMQYKTFLISQGHNAPTITGVTSTYVVNASPDFSSVTAATTTTTSTPTSTVSIQFQVRDTDTTTNYVTSSYEYSTSSGVSWTSITSASLNSTSTVSTTVDISSYTSRTVTWSPSAQIPGVYATSVQVRVTANDFELANNLGRATGTLSVLDTKNPTSVSLSFDSRNGTDTLTIGASDDSNLQFLLSNSSDFSADGLNSSSGVWSVATTPSLSTTTTWNATGTPSYERVYLQVRDIYGNTATTSVVAPHTPQSVVLSDISNVSTGVYSEYLSWATSTDTTGATTAFYEIYRSTNNTSSFAFLASTTATTYINSGLNTSITYYYRITTKTTQGNYSNYSDIVGDQPNGRATNIAPEFNTSLDSTNQTGVIISQVTSTASSDWGKVQIQYSVRDADTHLGSSTPGYITPSFAYNIGSGWVSISGAALNSTSTNTKAVSSSSYTTYTAIWSASTSLPSQYTTNLQVRVTADDGESANNTTPGVSTPITLDTTAPTLSSSLLVNGYTANAPATSTSVTLRIQSITGAPSGETIYPQFSNDGSTWYGMSGGATTTGLGTAVSSTAGALSSLSWSWVLSGTNTVYLRVIDALNNYSATSSVDVQGINQAPQVQTLTVSQSTTTIGLVNISYQVQDSDQGSVSSSFAYSTDGASWTTLSGMNATATALSSLSTSSWNTIYATWNASSQIPNAYTSGLQVRVTLNDAQAVNSSTVATTSLNLDTLAPTRSLTLDARTTTGTVTLSLSDNNNLEYLLSNSSTLVADGQNASSGVWITVGDTSLSTSTAWNLAATSSHATVYLQVRDLYGNVTSTSAIAPGVVSGMTLQDISERASGLFKHLITWTAYEATTSASLAHYEVYRSSNNSSSFARVATTTNNSYTDLSIASTTVYYYRVVVVTTNGNYSDYSSIVSGQPTGSANTAPNFNTSLDSTNQTGATILHSATSSSPDWGRVQIQYSVRDTDTNLGSSTPGYITPSFEYNIGSGWVNIATSTLNSTSTDNKTVTTSSYNTYTAVWSASTSLPSTYTTNLRVRVTADDNESSNNTGQAVTAPITLDTTAPTLASTSLLINNSSDNAEATSTAVTLKLQSITGTPSGESVYIQFSNDGSTWYAGNADGTVTSTAGTLGSLVSSTAASLSAVSWPWVFSGSTVYVRVFDVLGNGPGTDSNTVYGYNTAPEIQNMTALQIATTTDSSWGSLRIDFETRDTDSSNNLVSSTFAFSTSSGVTWTSIPTSTLNATATASFAVSTSSYTAYSVVWNVSSTLVDTYSTDLRIRVTVNDRATVNNITSSTATVTLDTRSPSLASDSLLVNDSASSGQSTSSVVTLKLQNVTGLPTGETIYAQFSDDNSTWYGANSSGTLASSSELGSGFSSATSTLSGLSWSWNLGSGSSSRSKVLRVRIYDAYGNSGGSDTNSVGYNTSPDFNPLYGTNGLSVSQVSSSADSTWGKVIIQYNVRDTDTSVGSSTPGYITPSFEYSIGAGWSAIQTSTLGESDISNKGVNDSSYTTHSATWHASSQISGTYTTALQIRVTANDNESVSNTATATSGLVVLDTKVPSTTVQIDSRTDSLSITASDDSTISYNLSNASSLIADGSNASSGSWTETNATSTNTSSSWTLVAGATSVETVYYAVRDLFGNITTGSASAPAAPASTTVSDISTASSSNFKELISWTAYTATSGPTFASYEVFRATSADPSTFSLLASVSDSAQNYYTDTGLASSTTYYYKVAIKTSNGDYSGYGETVSDQPDGLSGAAAEGPTISDVSAAEVQASWARFTWTTDRVSDSKVEYSVATSGTPYSLSTTSLTLVTSHDITVNDLLPNTTYSFRVTSKDINNKQSTTVGSDFTTSGGPIISAVTTEAVTDHTASIIWNTNKDSDSIVVYATSTQNLRNATGTSEAGSTSLVGSPFQHRVTLSGLNTQTIYYYYVKSTDASANVSTEKNSGNFYTFSTAQDTKAPVISNILVAAKTQTAAVITWQTDEPANTQISYDTRSASSTGLAHRNLTTLDDTMTVSHAGVISDLVAGRTYYYSVKSTDAAGNITTADEVSFETANSETPIINYVSVGGGASAPADPKDKTAPGISDIEITDITPFSAKLTFKTNEEAIGFAAFGETDEYGRVLGEPKFRTDHMIPLTNLKLGTTYHLEVKASDKAGNFGTAPDQTFTTKFAVESAGDIAKLENVEQYQSEIDQLIESITPSLITPFVGKVDISDVTEDSAVIKWVTNTKTYGSVLYVADKDYDETKENPYLAEVSDTQPRTTTHQVKLSNLAFGQLYRFKVKAYTLPNVTGFSSERTFTTKSSKIRPDVVKLLNTSFVVSWQTQKKTTSFVEYQNVRTGQIKQSGNDASVTAHVVQVENLEPNATYRVRAFGYDEKNNIVESETITVTTKRDITPPVISGLKIDNTFVPGRNDRIQTVISWKTDEPSTSMILYGEGATAGKRGLSDTASSTDGSLNTSHNVIITNFKPGTIYQMQVVSVDSAGNKATSPPRVIITPKQNQSVFDVIVKNFEGTFKFVNPQ